MWLLLLEAFLALCLLVFIVAWTMWPKRRSSAGASGRPSEEGPVGQDEDPAAARSVAAHACERRTGAPADKEPGRTGTE